jgi:ABC-type glutathione transport system ATPase component
VSAALLEVRRLEVALLTRHGHVPVVHGIDLSIRAGETLGLVGESGSGKSLTALGLMALAPPGVTLVRKGSVRLDGQELIGLDDDSLRRIRGRRMAMVFQEPGASLNPVHSVGAQIAEAVRLHQRVGRRAALERAAELLAEVGIDRPRQRLRALPHELSGGQQQRVMIAMALAGDPDLLIADEPTSALDTTVQVQVLDLFGRLQADRNMACLLITHDLGVVARNTRRIAIMRHGRLVETAATNDLLANPQTAYAKTLLACRPGPHVPPGSRLPTLEESSPATEAIGRSMPGAEVMALEEVAVSYGGRWLGQAPIQALQPLSLRLRAGRTLGVVGESGSGKSTLARLLVGLVRPAAGSARLFGMPIEERFPAALRRRVQLVAQDPLRALNPRRAVAVSLAEPLLTHGIAADRSRLVASLAEVGLGAAHLDRYPHELSGGQRQRVNIARALVLDPELLICDEITASLDVSVQAHILNLRMAIRRARQLTLVVIAHDLAIVRHLADEVLVLEAGACVDAGPVADVLPGLRQA